MLDSKSLFYLSILFYLFLFWYDSVKTSHIYFNSIHVIIKRTNNERKKQTNKHHLQNKLSRIND